MYVDCLSNFLVHLYLVLNGHLPIYRDGITKYYLWFFILTNPTFSLKIHLNDSIQLYNRKSTKHYALPIHGVISPLPVFLLSQRLLKSSILSTPFRLPNLLVDCSSNRTVFFYFRVHIFQFAAFLFLFLPEIEIAPVLVQCSVLNMTSGHSLIKFTTSLNLRVTY